MDNQQNVVTELSGRVDRTKKALDKYDDLLEKMTGDATEFYQENQKFKLCSFRKFPNESII